MEYQKISNLLGNTPNQPSKFRTKSWVKINDDSRETYNTNTQINRFKSSLCDYSDAYIVVKGRITVVGAGATAAARKADRNDKQVTFKNGTPFSDCISEMNNT